MPPSLQRHGNRGGHAQPREARGRVPETTENRFKRPPRVSKAQADFLKKQIGGDYGLAEVAAA